MSRTVPLYNLQQIDSALNSRVARMREIDSQMEDSAELVATRTAHETAQALHATAHATLKKLAHEAEENTARLRAQEKRLYGGSIKNPKELSQVQEEVEHLKLRSKQQEDAVIEAMMAAEEAEEIEQARSAELEQVSEAWQKFKNGLLEEKETLMAQAKVLQVKRQRAISEMPWADLQVYERLRRSKAGVAVAEVREGLCAGCHVAVPSHVLRLARSSEDFVMCPTCARIIFPVGGIGFKEFDHDLDNINR
jgi:predicted  nucleic acid-binding Zn-ribbon protein